ncbi:helix-turn-helix domain-containing protein [Aurantimonas sp. MSK8Z-1]|uniref:helix-turn-helix domain-containing protein n=1 Tax=Mangrovibrevibacter kandeliae TaxID=2968473 RepID=UPI002117B524|nr:helix-turn-helix domain-containing protein [Aurantimonas sp. MSK8Z-1]MCW4115129.1 helix-turn-helix domain-containing protein [Aurantimonas sp. MSK8Z-1]
MGARLDTPQAARALVRRRLPLKAAHAALTEMVDVGAAFVTVPCVDDMAALKAELAAAGVSVHRHAPERLDVRRVRERTKLSQSAFALRFGLDESTLRNWEQGRSEPGLAALTLLWTIHRHPEAVIASLNMDDGGHDAALAPAR